MTSSGTFSLNMKTSVSARQHTQRVLAHGPNRPLPSDPQVLFRLILQMSLTAISEHAFRLLTVKLTVGDKAEFLVLQTVWSPWTRP